MEEIFYSKKITKYKNKTKKLKQIIEKMEGGMITSNEILLKILSIGFEFETVSLHPVLINPENRIIISQIGDINIKEKILLEGDYTTSSFEITPDYGNIKEFENFVNQYDHPYFVFSDTMFDEYYYEMGCCDYVNENKFSNTEFVITFYKPIRSRGIITECFKLACKKISNYIKRSLKINYMRVVEDDDSYIPNDYFDNLQIFVSPHHYVNGIGRSGYLAYILNHECDIEDINFKPQMTISVKLIDAVDVIEYLLSNTYQFIYDKFRQFKEMGINLSDSFIRNNYSYYESKRIEQKLLSNWLTLVFFNYFCYVRFKHEKYNNPNDADIYFKMFCPFLLRHDYSEIFPLNGGKRLLLDYIEHSNTGHLFGKHYNSAKVFDHTISDELAHDRNYINHPQKYLNYTCLLLGGLEQFDIGEEPFNIETKKYPYDRINKIILLEYRNFGQEISNLLGNRVDNILLDSLKLNQMHNIILS